MTEGNQPTKPLATTRPWLTVAGCLGGGMVTALVAILLAVLIALFIFYPSFFGRGPAGA